AKALGIVAIPAVALAMQQRVLQPTLLSPAQSQARDGEAGGAPGMPGVVDPETGRIDRDPHHCVGHVCGQVVVAPSKLMPKAKVYLHIDATDLTRLGGAVLVEKVGWISSLSLQSMLGEKRIEIQPVIDLNTIPAEHQYRPSARMREAAQLMFPTEAFPFSHTTSRGVDLDHTVPYRPSCRDPQTGVGQLAPLSRTVHRAKTVGAWHARQRIPGEIVWSSPLEFHYLVTPERTYDLNNVALE
ncbi:MAG: hypothetical protein ACOH1W_15565, partial [Tessaracoccus sp.]